MATTSKPDTASNADVSGKTGPKSKSAEGKPPRGAARASAARRNLFIAGLNHYDSAMWRAAKRREAEAREREAAERKRRAEIEGYRALLGVDAAADAAALQRAYRRRAKELHPDRNRAPDAGEQFDALRHAYEELREIPPQASPVEPTPAERKLKPGDIAPGGGKVVADPWDSSVDDSKGFNAVMDRLGGVGRK